MMIKNGIQNSIAFTDKGPRKGWRTPLNIINDSEQRDEEKEGSRGPFASERGDEPRSGIPNGSTYSYTYFGARYMDHELMIMWLSVDPMSGKYPSISPYAYCAWNPIKLVDPDGREWDPATEKDVISPYRAEVRKRMSMIEKKRNREGNPNLYQDQYFEYQSILQELDDLENDRSHIYKVRFDRDEPNDGVVNLCRNQDGKYFINITIKLKASSIKGNSIFRHLEVISHELKHAYQFFQGRLGFVLDKDGNQISSTNMQILEKEAFTRGDMFLSHNVTNGQSMKYDYNLDAESYELNEYYSLMPLDSYIVPENASLYWHPNHK